MKNIAYFTLLLFFTSMYNGFTQPLISPIDRFDTPDSGIQFRTEIEIPRQLFILRANPQTDDWLEFGFHQFLITNGPGEFYVEIFTQSKVIMNVSSGEIISSPTSVSYDIVHDASSVTIQDQIIVLVDSLSRSLVQATVSPNQQWIGGFIRRGRGTSSDVRSKLWNFNGNLVFEVPPISFGTLPP